MFGLTNDTMLGKSFPPIKSSVCSNTLSENFLSVTQGLPIRLQITLILGITYRLDMWMVLQIPQTQPETWQVDFGGIMVSFISTVLFLLLAHAAQMI